MRSWSQRKNTTNNNQFTMMETEELVTEKERHANNSQFTLMEIEELVTGS